MAQTKEEKAAYKKAYRTKNKEKIAASKKAYRAKNKEKIAASKKAYREANKNNIANYNKSYREANKEKFATLNKNWVEANKNHVNKKRREYVSERFKNDPIFKMINKVGTLLRTSFKRQGFKKNTKAAKILGCNYETFINHIAEQFAPGMTLENHGLWELDHITPIASAQTESEVLKLNHYTNFQPLWADDNRAKSDTMPEQWEKIKAAS